MRCDDDAMNGGKQRSILASEYDERAILTYDFAVSVASTMTPVW
jgi:hypothetical protein